MAKRKHALLVIFLLSIGLFVSSAALGEKLNASDAAKLYPGETTYSIFRKGKNIGKHSLIVKNIDNRIEVLVDSRITIRVLKIPVFRFRYVSKEAWDNDRLVSVNSTTTSGKVVEKASLQNKDNQSLLTYNDKQSTTNVIQQASNHWNISVVEQDHLFNTVKGVRSNVNVDFVGNQALEINGISLDTKHYSSTGDIIVESWYDSNNRWVKLAFQGTDGSQITYLIDNP